MVYDITYYYITYIFSQYALSMFIIIAHCVKYLTYTGIIVVYCSFCRQTITQTVIAQKYIYTISNKHVHFLLFSNNEFI